MTQTKNTNAAGVATFSIPAWSPGTYTFAVTNVAKTSYTYDSSANTETTDSITFP